MNSDRITDKTIVLGDGLEKKRWGDSSPKGDSKLSELCNWDRGGTSY